MAARGGPDRARSLAATIRAGSWRSTPAARHAGVLLAVWLGFDLLTGGMFLTARNLFNLSLQVAVVGIMAAAWCW